VKSADVARSEIQEHRPKDGTMTTTELMTNATEIEVFDLSTDVEQWASVSIVNNPGLGGFFVTAESQDQSFVGEGDVAGPFSTRAEADAYMTAFLQLQLAMISLIELATATGRDLSEQ
jgi:hypothetical protein